MTVRQPKEPAGTPVPEPDKTDGERINLLDLVPVRTISWTRDDEGRAVLLKPKYRHPFLVKYLVPLLKRPNYRIKLDDVGSFLWTRCDGRTAVGAMGRELSAEFGEAVEPLNERLALFLQSLERHGFIAYKRENSA